VPEIILVLYKSVWVAQKGADRPADRVDGHRLDRFRDEDLEQHRESGQGRLPQGLRPPYPAAFRGLTSARVAYRPRVQKESPRRLFFQGAVCIFGYRQFHPPMIKLPFKTADVEGQSRQPNFQNLSIRLLTDWCGFGV